MKDLNVNVTKHINEVFSKLQNHKNLLDKHVIQTFDSMAVSLHIKDLN